MELYQLIILLAVVIAGFALIAYLLHEKLSKTQDDSQAIKVVTDWMKQMQNSFETRLDKNSSELNNRLDKAASVIGELKRELGGVTEVSRHMRDLLAAPKTRGGFGEFVLEELLNQHLPSPNFQMQYKFKSGETVDAIIKINTKILCIDAKFPLENFRAIHESADEDGRKSAEKSFTRDVKKHIDDISKKYIHPQENTYDFAYMYVPSEAIYYEILRNDPLMEHARIKKVSIVSPQGLYYHLHVLAQVLRSQKINEKAQEILKYLGAVKQEASKFERSLEILSRHITNANNSLGNVDKHYAKLSDKIERASEMQALESPVDSVDALVEPEMEKEVVSN